MNGKERLSKIKEICEDNTMCIDCVIGYKICSYIFGDEHIPSKMKDEEGEKFDLINDDK